jgi:hypothetical protein
MLTIIGSYDQRTSTGAIAASEAHQMVKASKQPKKPKTPKKTWEWEDCRALAKTMKVLIGYIYIQFPSHDKEFAAASCFENGKMYSYEYNRPTQCYEALLILQRDRLARLSDEEAIAAAQDAKAFF